MKKELALKLLLIFAIAFLSIRIFLDYDPALLPACICIALFVGFKRQKDDKEEDGE